MGRSEQGSEAKQPPRLIKGYKSPKFSGDLAAEYDSLLGQNCFWHSFIVPPGIEIRLVRYVASDGVWRAKPHESLTGR